MLTNTKAFFTHKPSITMGFLASVSSLMIGIWVAALPAIKARLQFSDGSLGLSLLMAPVGSLLAVASSSFIFSRVKVGKAMLIIFTLIPIAYILLVNSADRFMFWSSLFFVGYISCLGGISSNAVVDLTEKQYNRKIMASCHGMYSLGGGISAGLAALFNHFHLAPGLQISLVTIAILLTLYGLRTQVLSNHALIHSDSGFTAPPVSILGLAFICFVTFMAEGCIADWSAIYLKEFLHSNISIASMGFAGFSVMMAIGRFNGDTLVLRTGPRKLVVAGFLVAAIGFVLVVALRFPVTAIIGFTMAGLGFSCVVPLVFSAAANVKGVSAAIGISAVATGGLVGFLVGPAMIGLIAEKLNLAAGLSLVLLLIIICCFVASRNRFLGGNLSAPIIELP